MKIDLDIIMTALAPKPSVITLGGKDFALRENLKFGEILLFDEIRNSDDDAAPIALVRGMFQGDAPPILDEYMTISKRLDEIHAVVAAKNPDLLKRKDKDGRPVRISSIDARNAFGAEYPESIADFVTVEDQYAQLGKLVGMVSSAIKMIVQETTPGNVIAAAIPMMGRQMEVQRTRSADSPESP